MRPLLGILVLSGILSVHAYEGSRHDFACEEQHRHCYDACENKHPYSEINREKCFNKCERHLRKCLGSPPVIIEREPPMVVEPYPPVFVEPYPYWGWGHPHHRHWR